MPGLFFNPLYKQGERTLSTDEMTGVQVLERKAPDLPLAPGKVQRRELEYIRHGTQVLIVSPDVVKNIQYRAKSKS